MWRLSHLANPLFAPLISGLQDDFRAAFIRKAAFIGRFLPSHPLIGSKKAKWAIAQGRKMMAMVRACRAAIYKLELPVISTHSLAIFDHQNTKMSRNSCILSLLSLLAAVTLIQAIGFPTGGGGGGCCCPPCGGGGGCCISSCGCGRKKREVVTPHLKGSEVPCPQTEWRELMNEALIAGDAIGSLSAVQSALHGRFGGNKFLVNCASRDEQQQPAQSGGEGEATALSAATPSEEMPTNIHFTSSGDGYCNVVREGIWCQAIVLHA